MLAITVGQGRNSPKGEVKQAEGVMPLAELLESLPAVNDGWWSAHIWDDNYRGKQRWKRTQLVALDIDYKPGGNHSLQPPHVIEQVNTLFRSGKLPGNIVYMTPRGFRLVFVLDRAVEDPELFQRVVAEMCRQVMEPVELCGLSDHEMDEGAAVDLARLLFSPKAVIDGNARSADVLVLREQPYPLPEVTPDAQVFEIVTGISPEIETAIRKYNEANPKDFPVNRGDCPVCHHRGCFGSLPTDANRWSCFSSNHEKGGRKGSNCWVGDSLDIDAFLAGTSPVSHLKNLGLLPQGVPASEVPGGPVTPIHGKDERELKSNSYASLCFILREPSLRERVLGHGTLEFDEQHLVPTLNRKPLGDFDSVVSEIREKCELNLGRKENEGFKFKKGEVQDALIYVAKEKPFHPVKEYLNALEWDGKERLRSLASEILKIESTPLHNAILRKWFLSAVARPMEPGCKVDTVLILTGKQGIGKSTFFSCLASAPWFCDSVMSPGDKDAYMLLHRAWIVEWSELEAMKRARDMNTIKGFITSQSDNFRPPYGREPKDHPRRCVITGTTNDHEILNDPTGGRRFLILDIKQKIDLDKLAVWRDQLWAEAVTIYRQARAKGGQDPWVLDDVESALLAQHQQTFENHDEWTTLVEKWLSDRNEPFAISDVLEDVLLKPRAQWTRGDELRVGKILRLLRCEKKTVLNKKFWIKKPADLF